MTNIIIKDDYFRFLNKQFKQIDKCFIDTFKTIYLSKNQTTSLNNINNKQIKFLVNEIYIKKNVQALNDFVLLLTHFMSFRSANKLLTLIKSKEQISDIFILQYIDRLNLYNKRQNSIYSLKNKCTKQEFGFNLIKLNMIKNNIKINSSNFKYLDIGCGNGSKTLIFSKLFDLQTKNIYGTDIKTWGPYSENKNFPFNFKYILDNGKLDYNNNKFDVITCFLTLHHVENLDIILNEIYRILKKGGLLVIIEHDCINYFNKLIIEIQHTLFGYFYDNNKNIVNHPLYATYYNNLEWQYILSKYNFKLLLTDNFYQNSEMKRRYDNQYYAIFKKK